MMAPVLTFMAGPTQTHRLWLSLLVGVLVLVGSPTAQTPDRHDDGDRTPFLNDYVGQYELTPTFILNVMRVGDALYVHGPRQSATKMRPRSETEFVLARSRLRIIFGVNPISREVDHLVFEQDGVGRRAEKLFEIAASADTPPHEIAPDALQRYVGTYEGQSGFAITISFEDGRLWAGMEGQPKRTLLPTSDADFLYENSTARLSFEVQHLVAEAPPQWPPGERPSMTAWVFVRYRSIPDRARRLTIARSRPLKKPDKPVTRDRVA